MATGTSGAGRGRPEPFAVSGVITLLFLASVYVWASVLSPEGRVAAVAEVGVKDHCASAWVVPDAGDAPIPMAGRPSGSVLGSGGAITVTVRGLTGESVVLQPPVVEVLSRRPALPGLFLPAPCTPAPSTGVLTVDLDRPGTLLAADGRPADFPYRVTGTEPDHIVIRPVSAGDDVEWRLRIPWTSGVGAGELVVDDDGDQRGPAVLRRAAGQRALGVLRDRLTEDGLRVGRWWGVRCREAPAGSPELHPIAVRSW